MNKTAIIFLDGWGTSHSFAGNAILTANPLNFNTLFSKYQGLLLKTVSKESRSINSSDYYYSIGCGQEIESREEKILNKIKNAEFSDNPALLSVIKNTTSYNSAVHIVADFVDSKNMEICKSMLQYFKSHGIEKIYFHIIVSDKRTIQEFKTLVKSVNVGQLLSIYDRSFSNISEDWEKAEKLFLSVLFSRHLKGSISMPAPVNDLSSTPVKVADNDSIIILNRERSLMKEFSLLISGLHQTATNQKFPHMLSVFALYPQHLPNSLEKKITAIFPDEFFENSLSNYLSSSRISQCKIFPKEKEFDFCYYFNGCTLRVFPAETRVMIDTATNFKDLTLQIIKSIKNPDYEVIFASLPLLLNCDDNTDIDEVSNRVLMIDACLLKIFETAVAMKINLIITSPFGGAEKLLNQNVPSVVPFIFIDSKNYSPTEKTGFVSTPFLYDKYTLSDIAPTVIDLFNLVIPKEMQGKSLVSL